MTQVEFLVTPAGLPLVVEPTPSFETVAVAIHFRGGSGYQGEVSGSAHFLEHCLFNGSRNYPSKSQLRLLVDEIGAAHNGITSREQVKYFFHCLSDKLEQASTWLQELVCRPIFDEQLMIAERGIIVNELARKENERGFAHWKLLQKAYYGNDPYAETPLGSLESIQTMSPQYLRDLYRRLYVKQNAQVAIAGPVTLDAAVILCDELFGELPDGDEQPIIDAPVDWNPCRLQESRPDFSQDFYAIGFPCFGWEDERYHAANVIGRWLNFNGMPLYQKLRDELNWVYTLSGGTGLDYRSGNVGVGGQIAAEYREKALDIIREFMMRLCNELISEKDLDILRNHRRMGFAVDEQDLTERLGSIAYHAMFTRTAINRRAELERYLSVTREEIRDVAQAIFSGPEKVVIVTNQ